MPQSKADLESLLPPPRPKPDASTEGEVSRTGMSRVEQARQRTRAGGLWQAYHARFIRTGSFFPIVHAMTGLMVLQVAVWSVKGVPDEAKQVLGGNTRLRPDPGSPKPS